MCSFVIALLALLSYYRVKLNYTKGGFDTLPGSFGTPISLGTQLPSELPSSWQSVCAALTAHIIRSGLHEAEAHGHAGTQESRSSVVGQAGFPHVLVNPPKRVPQEALPKQVTGASVSFGQLGGKRTNKAMVPRLVTEHARGKVHCGWVPFVCT